ncbi:PAS-domain containing protein [Rhodovibrionaceae bacterium A322]
MVSLWLVLSIIVGALVISLALARLATRRGHHIDRAESQIQELTKTLKTKEAELGQLNQEVTGLQEKLESRGEELEQSRTSSKNLQALLNALPQPIWQRDRDLNLQFCNKAFLEAVGTTLEEALEQNIELIEGSDGETARALATKAMDSGSAQYQRFHAVTGGQRSYLEIGEIPLPDGSLLGNALNLTELEEISKELTRHQDAHRAVMEQMGVGIAIFGPDMNLQFFNAAYARIRGIDESYLATLPHLGDLLERLRDLRLLPEQANFTEYKQQRLRAYQNLIDPLEDLLHLPNDQTLRMTTHPHPLGGVVMTVEDVTDTLRLERTYNTLLEVQRETLNNLYEGVAVYGADGRIKLSNPAFLRIWNLTQDFIATSPHVRDVTDSTRDFYPQSDEDWPAFREDLVIQATEPSATYGRLERTDQTLLDWSQIPLPDGASLFTYIDVTDAHRVELALRERNEALETTDRLKSEFIANISYELRTPLNAIIGFAEILQNEYFGQLNDRQAEYSQAIVESSQRLIALINDILDLASVEAGYLQLDYHEMDVFELVSGAQKLWQERAHARGLELKIDCEKDIGNLNCDERRLTQALFNLLSNSFKFTPEGGSITLGARQRKDELLLFVADTGIGIPAREQERVFEKFEQLSSNDPGGQRQQGAGLGLSLVKSLVELHGGWVNMESAAESGTTVTCHLPKNGQKSGPVTLSVVGGTES